MVGRRMMRYGKALGTLDWKVDIIPTLGSEKDWITEERQKQIMSGAGISKKSKKELK